MDQILIKDFTDLLNDVNTNENTVQEFLEENTELIPLPILENHHLHFNCVILLKYMCILVYQIQNVYVLLFL